MNTVEPGCYRNMSFEEYLRIDAINSSALKWAKVSMRHVHAALTGKLKFESKATTLGTLIHCLTLEPGSVGDRYVVEPTDEECLQLFRNKDGTQSAKPRRTESYKVWEKSQTKIVVSSEVMARAKACASEVLNDRRASAMLSGPGENEVVFVWDDQRTGIRCKARIDALRADFVIDLKSTADVGETFERQLYKLDYSLSGAFYRRAALSHDGVFRKFAVIAVDTSEVVGVRSAPMSEAAIDAADLRIDHYLSQIKTCQLADFWPGVESPAEWTIPEWASQAEVHFVDGEADAAEVTADW